MDAYKDNEWLRFESDYQEFCRMERLAQFQDYLECVGMLAYAELTSEPRDFGETEH